MPSSVELKQRSAGTAGSSGSSLSSTKYTRVSTSDDDDNTDELNAAGLYRSRLSNERRSLAREWGQKLNRYAHSIFWIGLAYFVVSYSDLIRVLRLDDRLLRPMLYIALVSLIGVIGLVLYLAFYVPLIHKLKVDDYNITHPTHIKVILVLSFICLGTFAISIWPVWGWVSLPITISLLMASIMSVNFIPAF